MHTDTRACAGTEDVVCVCCLKEGKKSLKTFRFFFFFFAAQFAEREDNFGTFLWSNSGLFIKIKH